MDEQHDAHVHDFDRHNLSKKDYPDREAWLVARRAFLTSTDVGAIVGVDRFSSALKVYAEKIRPEEDEADDDASDRMLVGRAMQDGIAAAYQMLRLRREGLALGIEGVPGHRLYFHARHPMHAASMDAWQWGDEEHPPRRFPLEIKSWVGGIDEPLESWLTQVQWQMHVTGTMRATIACAFGFGDVQWWDIQRDQEIIDSLVRHADEFYERHVKPGIPPASDGSESAAAAMRKLYPQHAEGVEVTLGIEHLDAAVAIENYTEQIKLLEQQKRQQEDVIKQTMGEAEVAWLPNGGKATWKVVDVAAHMRKASSSRRFRIWPPKGGKQR